MSNEKSLDNVFESLALIAEKHGGSNDNGLWNVTENLIWELRNSAIVTIDSDKMSSFNNIIDELCAVAEKYQNPMEKLGVLTQAAPKIGYCTQSKYIHRGCLCPSPVLDLLVDNVRRGKSAEKLPKTKKGYYKYYFDANGILIAAEKYDRALSGESPAEIEYIIREGDVEYGITCSRTEPPSITYLSKAC
jgi:hypothetical protein